MASPFLGSAHPPPKTNEQKDMNKSIIKNGSGHTVIQSSFNNDGKKPRKTTKYQRITISVAIATLIVAIIVGWDKIINFFSSLC